MSLYSVISFSPSLFRRALKVDIHLITISMLMLTIITWILLSVLLCALSPSSSRHAWSRCALLWSLVLINLSMRTQSMTPLYVIPFEASPEILDCLCRRSVSGPCLRLPRKLTAYAPSALWCVSFTLRTAP